MPDENELTEALRNVFDPELLINVVDLGLIYRIEQQGSKVTIDLTLTTPACPVGPQIMQQVKLALEAVDGVEEAEINLVLDPPWTPDRMTDEAREQVGLF